VNTVVLQVDSRQPASEPIARAAQLLRSGGLVAFPTETVYGLGANALDAAAVDRIFAAKGRPAANPLIVHAPDAAGARRLVADWPKSADLLAQRFWPGPLTLVLQKASAVPDIVTAGGSTLAMRVPAHPVALALLQASGLALAAPSANRSSRLSPTRAEHVRRDLDDWIDLILDGGPTPGGIESTVLDLTSRPPRPTPGGLESTVLDLTASPPRLLRPGLVSPTQIEALIGPIDATRRLEGEQVVRSPGLLGKHYAPATPLECATDDAARVEELLSAGRRVGWLTFAAGRSHVNVVCEMMPTIAAEYAARLYDALHRLDALGLDQIVVAPLPEGDEWLAIRDRLRRAAATG
jgi:L-threonylcarbamoyladenylate synthase